MQFVAFEVTEIKLYVPVVTLSAQSGLNWNKYLSKPELLAQDLNLNHLIESIFQRVNRLFVLAFADDLQRTSNKWYFIPNVEIKDYNVMIDGNFFFDQPVKRS